MPSTNESGKNRYFVIDLSGSMQPNEKNLKQKIEEKLGALNESWEAIEYVVVKTRPDFIETFEQEILRGKMSPEMERLFEQCEFDQHTVLIFYIWTPQHVLFVSSDDYEVEVSSIPRHPNENIDPTPIGGYGWDSF